MKNISLLLFTIAFTFTQAQNPTFSWAKGWGGTASDYGYEVKADPAGNVYTFGHFNSTADMDPGVGTLNFNSNGFEDIFISKLDVAGNFVWAKQIGGVNSDFCYYGFLDASGNIYLTGSFSGTVDFDPGAGIFNLTSASSTAFVLKLDASGNFVWAKQLTGSSADVGTSLFVDGTGNVFITGQYSGTDDFDPGAGVFNMTSLGGTDIFVWKLNNSGNFVWAKSMGGSSTDVAWSITIDNTGNVVTSGYFSGTGDFDPGAGVFNLVSFGGSDVFVSKLDASGNFIWAKQQGGTSTDRGWSMTTDPSGNIYTYGTFNLTADFDPGAGTYTMTALGTYGIFISKLDASGNFLWAKQLGGTSGADAQWSDIVLDPSGNIYTTGSFVGTADFDPGTGTFTMTAVGAENIFVSILDGLGNFVWAGQMGGGASGNDGRGIFVDNNSNIYVTGSFSNIGDFNAGVGSFTLSSNGAYDAFVTKYAPCSLAPSQPGSVSGSTSMCTGAGSTTYSIATIAGATSYTWSLPGGWSGSSSTNTISATPGTTGIFTITASNACGTSPQQTLNVTVNPLPTITVNSGSICSGQSFTITPIGANTYTIQGGSAVVSPTTTASYTVAGTSTAGCVSAFPATSNVTVNPVPTINASTSNTLICVGQSATLTASGASTYTWNPGGTGTNISVSPTVTSTYTLTGTDANGCMNSTAITQSVSACTGIAPSPLEKAGDEAARLYPNPTTGLLTVSVDESKQTIFVYNSLGVLIKIVDIHLTETEINLTEQPNGIYFMRIGSVTKKIIKN